MLDRSEKGVPGRGKAVLKKIGAVFRDCRGVTLIELLVVVGLMAIVTVAAFNFFGFAQRSWQMAGAEAEVESEAQLLLMQVERDVRSVKPGSQGEQGAEILHGGMGLRLRSFMGGEERIVSYLYQEDSNLLTRRVFLPAEDPVLESESEYRNIYRHAEPGPVFSLDGSKVALKLMIETTQGHFTRESAVDTVFTIRNRGVEQGE